MVMKLYGQGNIFNVQRAILPLFELKVDTEKELELVMVSLASQDHLQPVYTAKQVKLYKAEVLEGRPHVAAYTDRITARPGFQKCLQLDWDSATPLH